MSIPFRTPEGPLNLAQLRTRDVTATRIGDALAKINRYNGRTPEPFSVAAHSVLVSRLCPPEHRAWGLLHDAHEAFLGDIVSPVVDYLRTIDARAPGVIDAAKSRLDKVILQHWGIAPIFARRGVAQMDRVALQAEMYLLMDAEVAISRETADAFDRAVSIIQELPQGGDWRAARDLWIAEAHHLASLGQLTLPPETT